MNSEEYAGSGFERINLNNITPVLVIFGNGLLLSAIWFFCEIVYFYWKQIRGKKVMVKPDRNIRFCTSPGGLAVSVPRSSEQIRNHPISSYGCRSHSGGLEGIQIRQKPILGRQWFNIRKMDESPKLTDERISEGRISQVTNF